MSERFLSVHYATGCTPTKIKNYKHLTFCIQRTQHEVNNDSNIRFITLINYTAARLIFKQQKSPPMLESAAKFTHIKNEYKQAQSVTCRYALWLFWKESADTHVFVTERVENSHSF
jgi:hypothetical protein